MASKSFILAAVFCLLGLVVAHHPMLLSGFDGVQIRHEDPRLINFLLEHAYQWAVGNPLHRDVWSPPFFFPAKGTLAYSDTLLSAAPIYWPFRLAGFAADTAFQLWLMTCLALDFVLFFLLLRTAFSMPPWPSAMGSFLFAFAASRVGDVGHPQLLPHYFTLLALLAIMHLVKSSRLNWWQRLGLWTVAGLSASAQFYASFYMGWFLVFATALAFVWGIVIADVRLAIVRLVRRDWILMLAAGAVSAIPMWILLDHYLEVARATGYRNFNEVLLAVPKLVSWVYMGPHSWLYGWMPARQTFMEFGNLEAAHRIGIGWLTPLLCFTGLALGWACPMVRLVTLVGFTLFLLVTRIPDWSIRGLVLAVWAISPLAFLESKGRMREQIMALILYASLFWLMCPMQALLPVLPLLGLAYFVSPRLTPETRRILGRPLQIGVCLFPAIPPLLDSPSTLIAGALIAAGVVFAYRMSGRRLTAVDPFLLTVTALAVLAMCSMVSELCLWKYVYAYVPGAAAIRVSSRICLLLLAPLGIGFAFFWLRVSPRMKPRSLGLLAAFCVLEQGVSTTTYSKRETRARVDAIATAIRDSGRVESFFYSSGRPELPDWNDHMDAVWAGIAVGLPSINGYSGQAPKDWKPLYDSAVRGDGDEPRVRTNLLGWIRKERLDPNSVAWIRADSTFSTVRRRPMVVPGEKSDVP